eukprot:gene22506-30767_t
MPGGLANIVIHRRQVNPLSDNINMKKKFPTPLWRAAFYGQRDAVELLLKWGANSNIVNQGYKGGLETGLSTLYAARNHDIVALLEKAVTWWRLKNFILFLHTGCFSSPDWNRGQTVSDAGTSSIPTPSTADGGAPIAPSCKEAKEEEEEEEEGEHDKDDSDGDEEVEDELLFVVRLVMGIALLSYDYNGMGDRSHGRTICLGTLPDGDQTVKSDVSMPDFKSSYQKMEKIASSLNAELANFHVGRANAEMFHSIPVESYGTISNIAQVTLKSASKVSITVYDPDAVKKVADAIRTSSDLNMNPIIDGSTMEISIPKPSKETREATVKSMHKVAEKFKLEVRQVRKECMDSLKKCKGGVSDDDIKLKNKEIETKTEKVIDSIAAALKVKEKEILNG